MYGMICFEDLRCYSMVSYHWCGFVLIVIVWFGFGTLWYSMVQSVTFRFRNFSVSKLFHFFDGIGFGFENFWYRKKYRIRFRFFLVSKKVSDSVSKFFGIEKSIGFGFDFFWFRKSIGFGFEIFWYRKKDQIKSLENLPELRRFCELIELCELT